MRFARDLAVVGWVAALTGLVACSSSSSGSNGDTCTAADGGVERNNGGDVYTYPWTCGATSYEIVCACNELQTPPSPSCTCKKNGVKASSFDWTCGPLDQPTIAKCGFPVP